ncbi:MAG: hypothetical protein WA175_11710 [Candidatus Acidiferrales bacterium]
MKIVKTILVVLALSLLSAMSLSSVRADEYNKMTVITFSGPVEIPGQILPAGTYTFRLADSLSDRNIVQIFNADGSRIIATVLAINNYRLQSTDKTVVTFEERSGDNPDAVKAWFYPGDNFGQEFVYSKQRAAQLAVASNEPVPALADETADIKTAPIVAVTPDQKEVPVAEAIQTAPPAAQTVDTAPVADNTTPAAAPAALPKTASAVPLIALLGLASLGVAFTLKRRVSDRS